MTTRKCLRVVLVTLGLTICLATTASSGSTGLGQAPNHSQQFDQALKLAELRKQIVGKERLPAEEVFKNIKDYKGVPAAGLLRGMEFYTRSLGVDCTHCHLADQWEKDDKPTKQIAREMAALVDRTTQSLRAIKNLKSERPGISCATCHRGQLKPVISLG